MKTKKRGNSVFAVLLVIVLLLAVVFSFATLLIFSDDNIPHIGGYYLYMHETNDMEPDIPQNSLVLAKEAGTTSLSPGNKVLCYLSDGTLALRVIYQITVSEDGATTDYYPGTALDQGSELTIPRNNIFAICNWQSKALYQYVTFATSVKGVMLLLVVPCILLIILLLVKIARGSSDVLDEEDFMFTDEPELPKRKRTADNPLFEPGNTPASGDSLERKKSSISENFEKKPVNENSPYQKAVQERTMKFRIQQQNIEEAKRQEASFQNGSGTQVFSTQAIEEEVKQQSETPAEPVSRPVTESGSPAKSASVQTPAARTSSTPNIDDIVKPSELRAARTGQKINPEIAATDSIDDLLRVLEAEKKKL